MVSEKARRLFLCPVIQEAYDEVMEELNNTPP